MLERIVLLRLVFALTSINLFECVRVSHEKTIEILETEVKKQKSLLSSEKQLRFVSLRLSLSV